MDTLMKYISRTHRCANSYRGACLSDEGLGSCQHVYILHICREPGISQEQLARRICVNKSNVTRQLGSLEHAGFVTREPDPADRRVLRVFPTEKAQQIYPRVSELMQEWNRLLLEDFTPEEQETLVAMLRRVMEKAVSLVENQR